MNLVQPKNKQTLKWIGIGTVIILLCYSGILYETGLRLTPLEAVKANRFVGEIQNVLKEIKTNWCYLYIIETEEDFKTVLAEKHGNFWKSNTSFYSLKEIMEDTPLKMVSVMNYFKSKEQQVQLIGIWNENPKVKSIQVTREDGSQYTERASLEELILFQWDNVLNPNESNVLALDENEIPLYRYGYPENTNIFRDSECKWYPIENE